MEYNEEEKDKLYCIYWYLLIIYTNSLYCFLIIFRFSFVISFFRGYPDISTYGSNYFVYLGESCIMCHLITHIESLWPGVIRTALTIFSDEIKSLFLSLTRSQTHTYVQTFPPSLFPALLFPSLSPSHPLSPFFSLSLALALSLTLLPSLPLTHSLHSILYYH
jgi:hypothetical protein